MFGNADREALKQQQKTMRGRFVVGRQLKEQTSAFAVSIAYCDFRLVRRKQSEYLS